jgi:hypothetical protein
MQKYTVLDIQRKLVAAGDNYDYLIFRWSWCKNEGNTKNTNSRSLSEL